VDEEVAYSVPIEILLELEQFTGGHGLAASNLVPCIPLMAKPYPVRSSIETEFAAGERIP